MNRYQIKDWRDSMKLRLDYNNMMVHTVKNGIADEDITALKLDLDRAFKAVEAGRDDMKWRELPYNQAETVEDILRTAGTIQAKFDNFVVLGIGGSALGPIAVHQALCHLRYNELTKEARGGCPKLYVEDNVDPERMAALLDVIDVKRTCFNVITKSGSTSETMSQLLIVTKLLKNVLGEQFGDNIIATTDKAKGNLIKIAKANGIKTFYVPDGVGGRFSELSPVGLLAAAVCGIDIKELLAGAAYIDELCSRSDIQANPAFISAALQVIAMRKGCNISVMMPYADSLKYIADWYAQLWAESLGKRYDKGGREIYSGQTPVKALGVTDQHSQVQLYTEGPFDKVITFLGVENYRSEYRIPNGYEDIPDIAFLGGHTLNKLINAERFATEYAIAKSGHLSYSITLPQVNAFTIGELLYLFEMQTAFAGELLSLNAFDQPGVEEGKNATYALLGKSGFEAKKAELDTKPPALKCYII